MRHSRTPQTPSLVAHTQLCIIGYSSSVGNEVLGEKSGQRDAMDGGLASTQMTPEARSHFTSARQLRALSGLERKRSVMVVTLA